MALGHFSSFVVNKSRQSMGWGKWHLYLFNTVHWAPRYITCQVSKENIMKSWSLYHTDMQLGIISLRNHLPNTSPTRRPKVRKHKPLPIIQEGWTIIGMYQFPKKKVKGIYNRRKIISFYYMKINTPKPTDIKCLSSPVGECGQQWETANNRWVKFFFTELNEFISPFVWYFQEERLRIHKVTFKQPLLVLIHGQENNFTKQIQLILMFC